MNSPQCPTCAGPAIPVVWGKPDTASIAASDAGLVRLGGCIVRGSADATWWCSTCELSFAGPPTHHALAAAHVTVTDE